MLSDMATVINATSVGKTKISCHFVPAAVGCDSDANVSQFFVRTIAPTSKSKNLTNECKEELAASFRGRPLNGEVITVPAGYSGLVLEEPHKRLTEEEDRQLIVSNTFDEFTYWNLDQQPTKDDLLQRALQWIDISAAIHKPVKETSSSGSSQEDSQTSLVGN